MIVVVSIWGHSSIGRASDLQSEYEGSIPSDSNNRNKTMRTGERRVQSVFMGYRNSLLSYNSDYGGIAQLGRAAAS